MKQDKCDEIVQKGRIALWTSQGMQYLTLADLWNVRARIEGLEKKVEALTSPKEYQAEDLRRTFGVRAP